MIMMRSVLVSMMSSSAHTQEIGRVPRRPPYVPGRRDRYATRWISKTYRPWGRPPGTLLRPRVGLCGHQRKQGGVPKVPVGGPSKTFRPRSSGVGAKSEHSRQLGTNSQSGRIAWGSKLPTTVKIFGTARPGQIESQIVTVGLFPARGNSIPTLPGSPELRRSSRAQEI